MYIILLLFKKLLLFPFTSVYSTIISLTANKTELIYVALQNVTKSEKNILKIAIFMQ